MRIILIVLVLLGSAGVAHAWLNSNFHAILTPPASCDDTNFKKGGNTTRLKASTVKIQTC